MIRFLRGLFRTPTRLTAMAGYVNLAVITLTGLLSFPVALHFLSREECGVWSLLSEGLGLFLLLDFGVSSASARMIAEPLRQVDQPEIDSWWTVTLVVMTVQGLLLLALGLLLQPVVFSVSEIRGEVEPAAHILWVVMIAVAALKIPFQAWASILYCQNRFYHMHFGSAAGGLVNFVIFVVLLNLGYGLKSYMVSFAAQVLTMIVWWLWSVGLSRVVLHFDLRTFRRSKLKELFTYSNDIFIAGFANQAASFLQKTIISNLFGVAANVPFGASTRSFSILSQVLTRTSEAKIPRWWNFYLEGDPKEIVAEWKRLAAWFIPAVFFCGAGMLVFNRSFVILWTRKLDVHLGLNFDLVMVGTLIVMQLLKSLQFVFAMTRKTRAWAILSVVDASLTIGLGYLFARWWGITGLMFGSLLGSMVSSLPLGVIMTPKLLGSSSSVFYDRRVLIDLCAGFALMAGMWLVQRSPEPSTGWFPTPGEWSSSVGIVIAGAWTFVRLYTGGLLGGSRPAAPVHKSEAPAS